MKDHKLLIKPEKEMSQEESEEVIFYIYLYRFDKDFIEKFFVSIKKVKIL